MKSKERALVVTSIEATRGSVLDDIMWISACIELERCRIERLEGFAYESQARFASELAEIDTVLLTLHRREPVSEAGRRYEKSALKGAANRPRPKEVARAAMLAETTRVEQAETSAAPSFPLPRKISRDALYPNAILRVLEEPEIGLMLEGATFVDLAPGQRIYRADEAIEHVFFPIDCVLSQVTSFRDGSRFEIGSYGREGFSAVFLLFGATKSPNECYCQIPGAAIKIDVARFDLLRNNPQAREGFARYADGYIHSVSRLAACNGLHNARERFSRWLLTTHDRVNSPVIRVSREYLAMVLGVTHSEATLTVKALQDARLVSYIDGILTVLDRPGLEAAACNCYSVAGERFERSLQRAAAWISTTPLSLN